MRGENTMMIRNLREQQLKQESTLCKLEWLVCRAISYSDYYSS